MMSNPGRITGLRRAVLMGAAAASALAGSAGLSVMTAQAATTGANTASSPMRDGGWDRCGWDRRDCRFDRGFRDCRDRDGGWRWGEGCRDRRWR